MTFADIASGSHVFLDANTFVYYFSSHAHFGPQCNDLIRRIEFQEVVGYTSTHVLTEVAHRLMMIDAVNVHGWPTAKVKQRLQRNPDALASLTSFRTALGTVLNSRIEILAIEPRWIDAAAEISQQHGLLSNDALIIAVMDANGLTALASHDADFDRVPRIARYAPV